MKSPIPVYGMPHIPFGRAVWWNRAVKNSTEEQKVSAEKRMSKTAVEAEIVPLLYCALLTAQVSVTLDPKAILIIKGNVCIHGLWK